ncbi:MAG: acylphosphatase [Patescibacteria group bacterium]
MVAHVFVSGFVQNVGYRQFVKKIARQIGLTGWVRNLSDGRVEFLFSGSRDEIKKAIEECWKGPFLSEVKSVDVEWPGDNQEYKDFEILQ